MPKSINLSLIRFNNSSRLYFYSRTILSGFKSPWKILFSNNFLNVKNNSDKIYTSSDSLSHQNIFLAALCFANSVKLHSPIIDSINNWLLLLSIKNL